LTFAGPPLSFYGTVSLPYRCLIIDHDDTAVDSTPVVHYPAHLEAVRTLRPGRRPIDLEAWFLKNFHPGIMAYLAEELGFDQAELQEELRIWRRYTASITPPFFPGFLETLARFKERGGIVAVVSHSEQEVILSHYRAAGAGSFEPDAVYGWQDEEARRKPSPWPVQQILARHGLSPRQALILDDLKPGVLMSRASGVPVAAAGWSHRIPAIEGFMRAHCLAYFATVAELDRFVLREERRPR
jgi:phosphoglycolate phosphatase